MDKDVLEKVETKVEQKTIAETKVETEKQVKLAEKSVETKKETSLEKPAVTMASKETSTEQEKPIAEEKPSTYTAYISTFENLTLKDVKKVEEDKEENVTRDEDIVASEQPKAEGKPEKEEIKAEEKEEKPKKTTLIIEKPNYDLMSKKKGNIKKKKKLKTALLACALAVCTIGCVAGSVVLDNMNSHYMQIEDSYNLNLINYLNKINNLNATNKGFEFIETYPEEINEISSIGESTNWFDNLVNFITGLFGG